MNFRRPAGQLLLRYLAPAGMFALCAGSLACGKLKDSPKEGGGDEGAAGTGGKQTEGTGGRRSVDPREVSEAQLRGAEMEVLEESHLEIPQPAQDFGSCSVVVESTLFTLTLTSRNTRLALTPLPLSPLRGGTVSSTIEGGSSAEASCQIVRHGEGAAAIWHEPGNTDYGILLTTDKEGETTDLHLLRVLPEEASEETPSLTLDEDEPMEGFDDHFLMASDGESLAVIKTELTPSGKRAVKFHLVEGGELAKPQTLIECLDSELFPKIVANEVGFDVAVVCDEWNEAGEPSEEPGVHLFHYENDEISSQWLSLQWPLSASPFSFIPSSDGGRLLSYYSDTSTVMGRLVRVKLDSEAQIISEVGNEMAYTEPNVHRNSEGLWLELPQEHYREDAGVAYTVNLCPILENGEVSDGTDLSDSASVLAEGSACFGTPLATISYLFEQKRSGELLLTDEGWLHVTTRGEPIATSLGFSGEAASPVLILDAAVQRPQRLSCQGNRCTWLSEVGQDGLGANGAPSRVGSLLFHRFESVFTVDSLYSETRSPLSVSGMVPFRNSVNAYHLADRLDGERIALQLQLKPEDAAPSLVLLDGDEVSVLAEDAALNLSTSPPIEMSAGYQIFGKAADDTLLSTFVTKEGEVVSRGLDGPPRALFWPCGKSVYSTLGEGKLERYEQGGDAFYDIDASASDKEHECEQELGLSPAGSGASQVGVYDLKERAYQLVSLPSASLIYDSFPHSSAGSRHVVFATGTSANTIRLLVVTSEGIEIDKELELPFKRRGAMAPPEGALALGPPLADWQRDLKVLAAQQIPEDLSQVHLLWHSEYFGSILSSWRLQP